MSNQNTIPAIQCQNLAKAYGDIQAVQPLSFEVPMGSIFGFLGRNGAGKTTTMRMLTGLAHPTSGQAWINGVEMSHTNTLFQSQFGYLPQEPAFYNWMTAIEYLDYIGRLFQMSTSERRQRIAEMLALTGIEKAAKRPIGGYSGGMKQRLGIAQALLHKPPVLLLDEPTSALDPSGRYELLDLIQQLRGEVTVFLSSHILADVERVCDRVAIIREGVLLLVAERDELLTQYATNLVALDVTTDSLSKLPDFLSALQQESWVQSVRLEGATVYVDVAEATVARQALFPLVSNHYLALNRYEWVRPSLEDVFLKVSA